MSAREPITDLRKVGARVRGRYFETDFEGTVERFDIFGNWKGADEVQVSVAFDAPMPIQINGELSDDRDGIMITGVPDCWSKSRSRERGFGHARSKDGLKWVEVL